MLAEIQKLISATTRYSAMQKMIIRSLTGREEIREELIKFIAEKGYNGKRAELAAELARIHPVECWNERTLNYLLGDSKNIDTAKMNQLLDYLEPDERMDFSFNSLEGAIGELRSKLNDLENVLIESRRTENKIDQREFSLLKSYSDLIITRVEKFISLTSKCVGQTLL